MYSSDLSEGIDMSVADALWCGKETERERERGREVQDVRERKREREREQWEGGRERVGA